MAKKNRKRNSTQMRMFKEGESRYSQSPSFTSTPDEIREAVEQNAFDRGMLLIKVIASLEIDKLLVLVDEISKTYDQEEFYEVAGSVGIQIDALKKVSENLASSYTGR